MDDYYEKHKDKIKKYQKRYYQKHKGEIKKYYQEHKEEKRAYSRQYSQEHIEEIRQYRQEHREDMEKYGKKYRREHRKEIRLAKNQRIKERRYRRVGDFLTERLTELSENQSWLAEKLGVSREAASKYMQGVYFPKRKESREKLCRILRIKTSDLEEIM